MLEGNLFHIKTVIFFMQQAATYVEAAQNHVVMGHSSQTEASYMQTLLNNGALL